MNETTFTAELAEAAKNSKAICPAFSANSAVNAVSVFLAGEDRGVEISLTQQAAAGGVSVEPSGGDLGGGVIRNVAVMSAGTAWPRGREPFEIDTVCLQQLVDLINAVPGGVKSRLTHPELQEGYATGYVDEICWLIGRVNNARLINGQVRADAQIATYADLSPNGKIGSLVKDIAQRSPADCGMSVRALFVFEERAGQLPLARVLACSAADFVGTAGANPQGLLSGNQPKKLGSGSGPSQTTQQGESMKLNERQRAYLASRGLATDATSEQIEVMLTGLNPAEKAYLDGLKTVEQTQTAPVPLQTALAGNPGATPPVAAMTPEQRTQIEQQALTADKARRDGIVALAKAHKLPESWAQGLADRTVSLAQATELAELAGTMNLARQPAGGRVEGGEDRNLNSLAPAMADAICLRGGVELYEYDTRGRAVREASGALKRRAPHARVAQFSQLSLSRLAERHLQLAGVEGLDELSEGQIVELAMNPMRLMQSHGMNTFLAMGTSDFPSVLGNVMRMTLRAMYAEKEQSAIWPQWCGRMVLPDYREMDLVSVSETPDLLLVPEGGDVRFASFTDGHESIRIAKFKRGLKFTQEAQKNDMFGVFARQIRNFAGSAIRLMDRLSTAVLTANANLADGQPLFVLAAHRNVPAQDVVLSVSNQANAAASVAALSAGRTALRTQLGMRTAEDGDDGPAVLNIQVKTLLTAAAVADTAAVLLGDVNPALGLGASNPIRSMGAVVANPYLDAAGATNAWYLTGDPDDAGGVVVAFLQGEEVPEVRTQVNFRTGDLEVVCEHKSAAKADGYRGMYRGHA